MLIRKSNGVADACGLIFIFVAVWRQQSYVAANLFVRGVHVAEDLCPRRIRQLLVVIDVNERSFFLALVAVKDSQRNAYVEAQSLIGIWFVERSVVGVPRAKCRICRAIRLCQLMVRFGLLNGFNCRSQIGAVIQRDLTIGLQRLKLLREIEWASHVKFVRRSSFVQ